MNTGIRVIAVSATMRMSNGCNVVNGQMREVHPPHNLIPLFQDLEYARSFYIGKTALSTFNALQNVSGGFGLFDTDVAIKAGGYDGDSFAEDMDMIARMIRYMCDSGESYRIVQIPEICCWTEGPSNLKILSRQRTRWGRGLLQMFQVHRDMVFNPAYRQYGLFTLPYIMVFELFAPLIEFTGYLMILWLFLIQAINYHTIWIVFLSLYSFAQFLSLTIISIDSFVAHGFKKQRDYLWLFLASLLEPFLYHPLNVFFSLRGYWKHIWGRRMVWGAMTRKGFQPAEASVTNGGEAGEAAEDASAEEEINA
jgi:cellulose synthase/poly-beta-1,6-N-acetylglucosamine synthase-like glycosyltransferase